MSRDEFMRRWEELPELKNAELIDGIVYMSSSVTTLHSTYDSHLAGWLRQYAWATPGCECGNNGTWLMIESAPQPDTAVWILPEYGGKSKYKGAYNSGAPELAIEICASTATQDLRSKLALYQRAGVREYLTLVLEPCEVVWRTLVGGRYVPLKAGADGVLKSRVFPGLWLDQAAAIGADGPLVEAVLRKGLASRAHAAFVRALQARKKCRVRAASGP